MFVLEESPRLVKKNNSGCLLLESDFERGV